MLQFVIPFLPLTWDDLPTGDDGFLLMPTPTTFFSFCFLLLLSDKAQRDDTLRQRVMFIATNTTAVRHLSPVFRFFRRLMLKTKPDFLCIGVW